MEVEVWRTAARSSGANNCVQVSNRHRISDSKVDEVLPGALAPALVEAVKVDRLVRR